MAEMDRILDEQRQAAEAVVNGGGRAERTWLDDWVAEEVLVRLGIEAAWPPAGSPVNESTVALYRARTPRDKPLDSRGGAGHTGGAGKSRSRPCRPWRAASKRPPTPFEEGHNGPPYILESRSVPLTH